MSLDNDTRPLSAIPWECLDCGGDGATLAKPRCHKCSETARRNAAARAYAFAMGRDAWMAALEDAAWAKGNILARTVRP